MLLKTLAASKHRLETTSLFFTFTLPCIEFHVSNWLLGSLIPDSDNGETSDGARTRLSDEKGDRSCFLVFPQSAASIAMHIFGDVLSYRFSSVTFLTLPYINSHHSTTISPLAATSLGSVDTVIEPDNNEATPPSGATTSSMAATPPVRTVTVIVDSNEDSNKGSEAATNENVPLHRPSSRVIGSSSWSFDDDKCIMEILQRGGDILSKELAGRNRADVSSRALRMHRTQSNTPISPLEIDILARGLEDGHDAAKL